MADEAAASDAPTTCTGPFSDARDCPVHKPASDAIPCSHDFRLYEQAANVVHDPGHWWICARCGDKRHSGALPASDMIPALLKLLAERIERDDLTFHDETWPLATKGETRQLRAALTEARATIQRLEAERTKQFPIQRERGAKPHPTHIPWSVAEKAFSVYSARGHSQSLERLAERGGFGPSEMDEYLPGWRDEVNALTQLEARLRAQQAALPQLITDLRALRHAPDTHAWFSDCDYDMEIEAMKVSAEQAADRLAAALPPPEPPA